MDALTLLVSVVKDNKVSSDESFSDLNQKLEHMEEKIDKLLAFKWQLIGGSIAVSIAFQIVIALLGSGVMK